MARSLAQIREDRSRAFAAIDKFRKDTDLAHKTDDPDVTKRSAWTKEEDEKFRKMGEDHDALVAEEQRAVRFESIEKQHGALPGREDTKPGAGGGSGGGEPTAEEREAGLRGWLAGDHASDEQVAAAERVGLRMNRRSIALPFMPRAGLEARQRAYRDLRGAALAKELRDLNLTGATGGYTVSPGSLVNTLEEARLAFGGLRQVATIIRTATGAPIFFPVVDDTANSGELVAEEGDNDIEVSVDPTFAQPRLDSFKLSSKPILVSSELLRDSEFDIGAYIGRALGERIGRKESAYFATGTGTGEPKGIAVAAAASGITTASATDITPDELLNVVHAVDPAYRGPGCGWVMRDAVVLMLRKKKDGTGNYIWQDGMAAGMPSLLWGYPVHIVQEMPAATAGLKPVVFGQLSAFKIRDVGALRLVRLNELFANTDQIGFNAWASIDSDIVDAGTHPVVSLAMHA